MNKKHTILVVDDDALVLDSISLLLREYGYAVDSFNRPSEALRQFNGNTYDVVLTDIRMPEISGVELLEKVHEKNPQMPVILITAYAQLDVAVDAVKQGAFDLIVKPYNPEYLIHTVEKAIRYSRLVQFEREYKETLEETVRKRTQELSDALALVKNTSRELIGRLTIIAEYRDTDTGDHISRIGLYSKKICEAMGLSSDLTDLISFSSSMHDIGKIGIPDTILLKPGPLTKEEFEIMKTHTVMGHSILSTSEYPIIQMGESIALNHHERWDGTGYPHGLKGESIPIEGRIVMIADQYDALRAKRPYKNPFTHEEAYKIITQGDGRTLPGHFDPEVLKAFKRVAPEFDRIFCMRPW